MYTSQKLSKRLQTSLKFVFSLRVLYISSIQFVGYIIYKIMCVSVCVCVRACVRMQTPLRSDVRR